ncbi:MAG TPA: nucleoside recognition domain-containing protein [Longimicrobiaceae bacterium]|nr:nucleoside recognition domain-containing protein [Longimicrobiaceae bacterium]
MLNYIWGGLIIASLLFAIVYDVGDLTRDRYRNEQPLPVELVFPEGYDPAARRVPVEIRIDSARYAAFYGVQEAPAGSYPGYLRQTREGVQLRFETDATFPEPLATIAGVSKSNDDELQGTLVGFTPPEAPVGTGVQDAAGAPVPPSDPAPAADATTPADVTAPIATPSPAQQAAAPTAAAALVFEPVRFVKLNAIAAAALDFAETAAEIALGLIGVLALFLGILKIAEDAGVIYALVKLVRPVLGPLFPEVPPDHPALGMIALNFTANIFGLGNAATPFGIKAMEELQKLNPTDDTATNPMVMLLAINTASVQLVPPVLLLALMGLQINQLIFAIIITTGLSLTIAIIATKLYGRLPSVRASDPNRIPPPDAAPEA